MGRYPRFIMIFSLILVVIGISTLRAIWTGDDVPVCTASNDQTYPQIIPDGTGRFIILWRDARSGNWDIFAQKIDTDGIIYWAVDGVPVCSRSGTQSIPHIASDGAAGAIVAWEDDRNDFYVDIYAQRIDSSGTRVWDPDGIPIATWSEFQRNVQLVPDGLGGVVMTWDDTRLPSGMRGIYAQRVDADGDTLWQADGVAVNTVGIISLLPKIASDGASGAIITWMDRRYGGSPYWFYDLFAQRVDSAGDDVWTAQGIPICTNAATEHNHQIVTDGSGGAIITWQDSHNGDEDIFAQRVDSAGTILWTLNGETISAATGDQWRPQIFPDGIGGAMIVWEDWRGADRDIYAQKVDSAGVVQWAVDGVTICTETGNQEYPQIASDGTGGAVIAWQDLRDGNPDIYAQRIDSDGNSLWMTNGVVISIRPANQEYPRIVSDLDEGALVVWHDFRDGADWDIYAQRIWKDGKFNFPAFSAIQDVPMDQGGRIHVQWHRSRLDTWPNTEITHYSVWRRLPQLSIDVLWADAEAGGPPDILIESGGKIIRFTDEGYSWEWIGDTPARHFANYTMTVESLYDSAGTTPGWQCFMVSAHTELSYIYYDSAVDSGYSVDNIAPGQPLSLAGEAVSGPPGLELTWDPNTEADLSHYAVYRENFEGFVPGPGNLVGTTADTTLTDGFSGWPYSYYKVSAVDIHGNESGYSQFSYEQITEDDPARTPTADFLAQNFPNPFNPLTTIAFGLARSGHVNLHIYDAAGRLVRVIVNESREAAWYEEIWDGTDSEDRKVASGVYFFRLSSGKFVQTRKMVLLR
jgi:hypothetical protein